MAGFVGDFVRGYVKGVNYMKWVIVIFWIICLGFGGWLGPKLLSRTVNDFAPPDSAPSAIAGALAKQVFEYEYRQQFAVFVYANHNTSVIGDELHNFTMAFNRTIYASNMTVSINQFMSYYTMLAEGFPAASTTLLLGPQNYSTIMMIVADFQDQIDTSTFFSEYLSHQLKKLKPKNADWQVELTGIAPFVPLVRESIEFDMLFVDGALLPVVLIVLALIIKSIRLLILTIAGLCVSGLVSFGVLWAITYVTPIISFAPTLMMTTLVAMSIDYSLFLLSRYREELLSGKTQYEAVEEMVLSGGGTVLLSGLTLAGSFLGLIVIPLNLMQSMGVACAITLFILVIVNLSLIPAMILIAPDFFARCVEPFDFGYFGIMTWGSKEVDSLIVEKENEAVMINQSEETNLTTNDETTNEIVYEPIKTSRIWYYVGKANLTFPWNIIILLVIFGCVAPVALYSFNYKTSDSMDVMLPHGNNITLAYLKMIDTFGTARVFPYELIMIPKDGSKINNNEFFKRSNAIITGLVDSLGHYNVTLEDFTGITVAGGKLVYSWMLFEWNCKFPQNKAICDYALRTYVNKHMNATSTILGLKMDPFGNLGDDFYRAILNATERISADQNMSVYISGMAPLAMDAIHSANSYFLEMILITCGVIIAFVAISFRSLLLSVRAVFTIILTLLWVYGLSNLVYEQGILNFMGWRALQKFGAIHWCPPLISFPIIAGLGLDYDIFLLVRIMEYRQKSYSTKESISLGVSRTGNIITAAGLIMAFAFSGLLFSSIALINMQGFYMVFSVLFDTLIVRTFVVPSLMSFFGELNWFPGNFCMPQVAKYHDNSNTNEMCDGMCYNHFGEKQNSKNLTKKSTWQTF